MTHNHSQISLKQETPSHWWQYPSFWIRGMVNWVVHWAGTRHAVSALFCLAFAESSFFPVPPDVLLIAMAYAMPARAFFYALVCSVGSVLGGLAGYAIGYFLWELVGSFFLSHVFKKELFDLVVSKYEAHSFWIVFIAAFTPIPYKVFTITAGVTGISLSGFILASVVGRSLRFFIVATVFFFFGKPAKKFIDTHFEWLTIAFSVLLIGGFVLLARMH